MNYKALCLKIESLKWRLVADSVTLRLLGSDHNAR